MVNEISISSEKQVAKSQSGRLIWVSLTAMIVAIAANLGLYYAVGILFPDVATWSGVGPGQIAGANFVYLFIGALVFAVVRRKSPRPARHFLLIASIGLLLSFALPISAGFGYGAPGTPPASAATVVTLCLMHIVSFAISVPMFNRLVSDK